MDSYEEQTHQNWQPLRPFFAKNCDHLVFICKAGREYLLNHWGAGVGAEILGHSSGCREIPRCQYAYQRDRPLVLVSCSSVIPIKRVALIADSLACLGTDTPIEWHHFGAGELLEEVKQHAQYTLANHPQIHYTFHVAVPNAELPKTYRDAGVQLFITTAETEGLPVSMMEEFAVIAAAVGGIPEMIQDGENGYLLPANPTPKEVAQGLRRYGSQSADEKQKMSQNALACWKEQYDARACATRLIKLLTQTLGEEKSQ